jgi:acylphosphatase
MDMQNDVQERLHAVIKGRVQGVGFRHFVMRTAGQLGVSGWVRNRLQGTVEVVAEGEKARLEDLVSALRKGPPGSFVERVDPRWETSRGEYSGFTVRRTV